MRPDVLTYLSNDTINKAKFYDHLTKTYHPVYTTEELQSIDSYNVFLGGPKALLTVDQHAEGFPTADQLRGLVKVGNIDFEGEMAVDTEGLCR